MIASIIQPAAEGIEPGVQTPMGSGYVAVEETVRVAVQWLRLGIEVLGAAFIAIGIVLGLLVFVRASRRAHRDAFTESRLTLARYLAVALEFQLAADVLSTAIAPSWEQLGKLAAIVVIRTALNFFLMREVNAEEAKAREAVKSEGPPEDPAVVKHARAGAAAVDGAREH